MGAIVQNVLHQADLCELYFGRDFRIHQGRPTICVNHLARDPAGVLRTEESQNVSDVLGCSQASHRSPPEGMPIPDEILCLLWQRVQYAVLGPPGADGIYCDATFCQAYRKVADQ